MMSRKIINDERGGTLIELVFTLPIVLAILFFFLSYCLAQNVNYSLHNAMANAVNLAATRSNNKRLRLDLLGKEGVLEDFHTWYDTPPSNFTGMPAYFRRGVDADDADGFMEDYVFSSGGGNPGDANPMHYYTLFYTYQAMEQTVGNRIKYPCGPWADGDCMLCEFFDLPTLASEHKAHFRCRFKPWTSLFGVVFALLGDGGGSGGFGTYGPELTAVVKYPSDS